MGTLPTLRDVGEGRESRGHPAPAEDGEEGRQEGKDHEEDVRCVILLRTARVRPVCHLRHRKQVDEDAEGSED